MLFGTPGPKAPVSFVAGNESCWRFVCCDRSDVARIFINYDYRIALIIGCRYGSLRFLRKLI